MNRKRKLILILLVFLLSSSPMAFAWDPTTNDLSGTNSSTDYSVAADFLRFDIDSTTAGLQIGEDAESIAFLLVMAPISGQNGLKVFTMEAGDQYQISFTISLTDFALVFRASDRRAGSLKLFYKDIASEIWETDGDTMSVSKMDSGEAYISVQGNIGFTLTDGTSVKLVISKYYLVEKGASEISVTRISGATFALGDGTPGSGGADPNDRCPASGEVSFSLLQGIDDFPHGTLVLAIPVMGLYVLFRRKKRELI